MSDIGQQTTIRILDSSFENRYNKRESIDFNLEQDFDYENANVMQKFLLNKNDTWLDVRSPTLVVPQVEKKWKKFSLVCTVTKFITKLKRRVRNNRSKNLNPRIFPMLNDKSADINFYQSNGLLKGKLSSIKEYMETHSTKIQERLLMPESSIKLSLDIVILGFTILNLIYIPFKLAFLVREQEESFEFFEIICNCVPYLLYLLEIPISLNSAYYYEGHLLMDKEQLKQHYFQGNFYKDICVIVIFPLCALEKNLLMIVWLLRISRVQEYLARVESATSIQQLYTVSWELSKLVGSLIFVNHIVACAWRYFALIEEMVGITNNWVKAQKIEDAPWDTQYIYSFYWSTITSTTIGYGDVIPVNRYEMLFVIIMVPVMLVLLGYVLGCIQSLFVQIKSREDNFIHKMGVVNNYIRKHKLDQKLSMKIRNYFDCYLRTTDNEDEAQDLMDQLHDDIKYEVNEQVYQPILHRSDFIKEHISQTVQSSLCQQIKYCKYLPGQNILSNGDIVGSLVFVMSGKIQLYVPRDDETIKPEQHLRFLVGGETIAEVNFILQQPVKYHARAIDYTEVVLLKYEDFIKTLKKQAEEYEKFSLLKDNLQFNPYYKAVQKKCDVCLNRHLFEECPLVFYQANKHVIRLRKERHQIHQRKQWNRRKNKPANRQSFQEMVDLAILASLENNIIDEDHLTDDFLKKVGLKLDEQNLNEQKFTQRAPAEEPQRFSRFSIESNQQDEPSRRQSARDRQHSLSFKNLPKTPTNNVQAATQQNPGQKKEFKKTITKHHTNFFTKHEKQDNESPNAQTSKQVNNQTFAPQTNVHQSQHPQRRNERRKVTMVQHNLNQISKEPQIKIPDIQTLHESTYKNEDTTSQATFHHQLNQIKLDYLENMKQEAIIGFEKQQEYKHYYPLRNFHTVFARKPKASMLTKEKRSLFKGRITLQTQRSRVLTQS